MILCCGEALIDMIPTPTNTGRDGFVPHSGGAIFNTAIALGRLGTPVGMVTGLSSDMFGDQLRTALSQSHVDTTTTIRSDRPSTLAFVKLTDGQASYSFYDENSAGRMLTLADMPVLGPSVSGLFFGGISLACEPCADAYAALLERECIARVVMIDPNIRPGFIQDENRYRARLDRMLRLSDIVKISDEDLNWIDPGPQSLGEKVSAILGMGPSLVILTRGGDGATGYLGDGSQVSVPARIVTIVDTVGAGDTFNAGVLAKLFELGLLTKSAIKVLSTQTLEMVLSHGADAAAVTVSRAGANPPWTNDL